MTPMTPLPRSANTPAPDAANGKLPLSAYLQMPLPGGGESSLAAAINEAMGRPVAQTGELPAGFPRNAEVLLLALPPDGESADAGETTTAQLQQIISTTFAALAPTRALLPGTTCPVWNANGLPSLASFSLECRQRVYNVATLNDGEVTWWRMRRGGPMEDIRAEDIRNDLATLQQH